MSDQIHFRQQIEPYMSLLLDQAGHDLRYHEARGDIPEGTLTPEEVAGETLLRAFHWREHRPQDVSLRDWLLGTEGKVMHSLMNEDARQRKLWSVSLEEQIPEPPPPAEDDTFWDWYQPDEQTRWEDVLPSSASSPLENAEQHEAAELEPQVRRAWILRDVHSLVPSDIARAMGIGLEKLSSLLQEARELVRKSARQSGPT